MPACFSVALFKTLDASASGSIAIQAQAPLTLFRLCLPSDVIIPTLIVTSFFVFLVALKFLILMSYFFVYCQTRIPFPFPYRMLSCQVGLRLYSLIVLYKCTLSCHNLYKIMWPHYLDNCHMPRKILQILCKPHCI